MRPKFETITNIKKEGLMWNEPSRARLDKIPRLYETDNVSLNDKLIYLHFYIGGSDWFVAEYDGQDIFFGFVILNGDFAMAEWGYISFSELRDLSVCGIEVDCELEEYFPATQASAIDKICKGNGLNEQR